MRILFICSGNINRSPAAEVILKSLIAGNPELKNIEVASSGVGKTAGGKLTTLKMMAALKGNGYDCDRIRSTKLDLAGANDATSIIVFTANHAAKVLKILGVTSSEKVVDAARLTGMEFPDPHFDGSGEKHWEVLSRIEIVCHQILQALISQGCIASHLSKPID